MRSLSRQEQNRALPFWRLGLVLLGCWLLVNQRPPAAATPPLASLSRPSSGPHERLISTFWPSIIQHWAEEINVIATLYGLDPDLIAAIINTESSGLPDVVSRAGAVGLMGVLPAGPGMEWRPSTEALKDPTVNLNWGGAILSDIIQQAGGDIAAALAAYSGGWEYATGRVTQAYASQVLDEYGRAVAVRNGISPDIASLWTVAVRIERGNITSDTLVMNRRPASGIMMFGEHVVFQTVNPDGQSFYVRGYAVPLILIVPQDIPHATYGGAQTLDPHLIARVGLADSKVNQQNPHLVLACLPTLERLRGQLSTRWYAPSSCPFAER